MDKSWWRQVMPCRDLLPGGGWPRFWGWLLACLLTAVAEAHPHVWISASLVVQVQAERITALRLTYTFDPAYSSLLIGDFDKNKDGQLDASELVALGAALQKALQEPRFFSHLAVAEQDVEVNTMQDVQIDVLRGSVQLSFTLLLPKPVDPKTAQFDVALFDPTNYVAILYTEQDAIRINGNLPGGCSLKALPVTLPQTSIGALLAKDIRIVCP